MENWNMEELNMDGKNEQEKIEHGWKKRWKQYSQNRTKIIGGVFVTYHYMETYKITSKQMYSIVF